MIVGPNVVLEDDPSPEADGPSGITLGNHPNPFNPSTEISFSLPEASDVRLQVINVTGRIVETLVDGYREAGVHTVTWAGNHAASGVYFYRLEASDYVATRKMLLMK